MAKHLRQKPTRAPRKKPAGRSTALARRAATVIPPVIPTAAAVERKGPPPPPGPPPRKPGYYEAIAIYESGVRALQRHDYEKAADQFREIISRYPQERELHERSVLYLRVCERETARRPSGPQTPQERVYAATVALNAGDSATALDHLRRALTDSPDSDHAHYIMAVALASHGQSTDALGHLKRSIELNPENRALAKHDPDLEDIRELDGFRETLETPGGAQRARQRRRR
jgi:tetratricopeptide (TPR) repeat protein